MADDLEFFIRQQKAKLVKEREQLHTQTSPRFNQPVSCTHHVCNGYCFTPVCLKNPGSKAVPAILTIGCKRLTINSHSYDWLLKANY